MVNYSTIANRDIHLIQMICSSSNRNRQVELSLRSIARYLLVCLVACALVVRSVSIESLSRLHSIIIRNCRQFGTIDLYSSSHSSSVRIPNQNFTDVIYIKFLLLHFSVLCSVLGSHVSCELISKLLIKLVTVAHICWWRCS